MTCPIEWEGGYHECIRPFNHATSVHLCGCAATYNSETGDACD